MNHQDIQLFMTLVETKNIFHTAELLFLSQSTVSLRLMHLEEELGFQLFYRQKGKRIIELTKQGEMFIDIAKQWEKLLIETKSIKYQDLPGNLVIGCFDSLNSSTFISLYDTIFNSNPSFHMTIKTHHTHDLYEMIEKGRIDVGFVHKSFSRQSIQIIPIFREQMYYVTYGHDSVSAQDLISVKDLDPSKEVFTSWSSEYELWHSLYFPTDALPAVSVDKFSLHQMFLHSPDVWGIIPSTYLRLFERKDYTIASIKEEPPARTCYMILSNPIKKSKESMIQEFRTYLLDYLSNESTIESLL